jgi:hypothetical protein
MEIILFMPFTLEEQAVVAHRFLLELNKRIKQPVSLAKDVDCYIGHSEILLFNSRDICTTLAEQDFDRESGARSLKDAVKKIEMEYAGAYRQVEGLVDESVNDGPLLKFDLVMKATAAGISVFKL